MSDHLDFNQDQRQKVANLGLEALDVIDQLEGEHVVGDAMLLLEVLSPDEDEGTLTEVCSVSTSYRVVVRRGIVEQARYLLADSTYCAMGD